MMKITIEQPRPFDHAFIRYCPQRPFPPYRHIPGITPHPFFDPHGHSYGLQAEENIDDGHISLPADWRKSEDYLYGVDLCNFAYWWEAGEVWEGLWKRVEGDCKLFLQGLIQISVSLLKHHLHKLQGLRHLSTTGRDKLRQVLNNICGIRVYMGIDLVTFLTCLDEFFSPFFSPVISDQTYQQATVKPMIYLHF